MKLRCRLCSSAARFYTTFRGRDYYICRECLSVFMDPAYFLTPEEEKRRYREHKNNPLDPGYRKFVLPAVNKIKENFTFFHRGLDYGCGTGSALSRMLRESGYKIFEYDPFFFPGEELLNEKYDYIACTEVIEHFQSPAREFEMLKELLKKGGKLICKTEFYRKNICFNKWYYKNEGYNRKLCMS